MSHRWTAIIIEDEPLATEILVDYLNQLPQIELLATFPDALYASSFLRQQKVELIFLDLHLPRLKGFDFLKTLTYTPQVIVTTAYHHYALESYDLQVLDYLLKPIEFSRLLKAVNKLKPPVPTESTSNPFGDRPFHFFNVNKKQVKVWLDEILYVESQREYVCLYLEDRKIITKATITSMSELLKEQRFLRIHRSFLVALDKIQAYSASKIELPGQDLPIGRSYRQEVLKQLETWLK